MTSYDDPVTPILPPPPIDGDLERPEASEHRGTRSGVSGAGWRTWLAILSSEQQSQRLVRVLALLMAAIAFVLGIWGWIILASSTVPRLDTLAILYRTIGLFALDSNGAGSVPWQLDAARLLAPVATATAALAALSRSLKRRLHRVAARSSKNHRVGIGPYERVRPYFHDLAGPPVMVDEGVDATEPHTLHVCADWERGSWVDDAAVLSADLLVIATGDDERNLHLLNTLLERRAEGCPRSLRVELDHRSTASWMALFLAVETPDLDADVICRDEGLARQAATDVLLAIREADPRKADPAPPTVALVGDGSLVPLLTTELGRCLMAWHQAAGGPRPRLLLGHHPDRSESLAALQPYADKVEVVTVESTDEMLSTATDRLSVVVTHSEGARTLRVAVQIAVRRPAAAVFVPERRRLGSLRLSSLDPGLAYQSGALDGPFVRTAARFIDAQCARRPERRRAWSQLSLAEKRDAVRWVRTVVSSLSRTTDADRGGWRVDYRPTGLRPEPLPRSVAATLAEQVPFPFRDAGMTEEELPAALLGMIDELMQFPHHLWLGARMMVLAPDRPTGEPS